MHTRLAVILVAGVGSRLQPLTDSRPKALVEVAGRSILSRALDNLLAYGVENVVLATGYRKQAVEEATRDLPLQVSYVHNPEFDRTQNSVSLCLCREALAGRGFFKLDGDVIFRPEVLARLDEEAADLAVAVDCGRKLDAEAMKVRLATQGRIAAFGKGIALDESAGESIGIERVAAPAVERLFDALERARRAGDTDLYYEDIYSKLIGAGQLDAALVDVSDLPWTEIDDHADLEHAQALVG